MTPDIVQSLVAVAVRGLITIMACFGMAFAADIGISPTRLELEGTPGGTIVTTARVLTTADTEQLIAIHLSDWVMGVSGSLTFLAADTTATSAASWLVVEVSELVLPPSGTRDLRLDVSLPEDAEGTHHAMVFFTVVPPPRDDRAVGVATTTRIGLTVYVTVTGTERSGSELVDMYQPDEDSLTAVILNTGNTVMRLGGVVEIRDEAGDVVRRLDVPDVPVLRESERELTFALPDDLESGFYVALALIEDSRGGILAGELPFDVP